MSRWFREVQRPQVSTENLLKASEIVMVMIGKRLEQYGKGAYLSAHEMLGMMTEEYEELIGAVHSDSDDQIASELEDIAVVAIFGIASMLQASENRDTYRTEEMGE